MTDDLRDDEAPLAWAERMMRANAIPAFIPVHVGGEPGIGWAAYEGDVALAVARCADGNLRASVAIVLCARLHREAAAIGADA